MNITLNYIVDIQFNTSSTILEDIHLCLDSVQYICKILRKINCPDSHFNLTYIEENVCFVIPLKYPLHKVEYFISQIF